MRAWAVIAVALLAVTAFAGCSGKDKDDKTTSSSTTSSSTTSASTSPSPTSTSSSTTTSSSSSSSSSSAGNVPPTAILSAGAATPVGTTGLFTVIFSLDGKDPESKPITWKLSFGDATADANGTALPTTVSHNYTAAGNYTAKLTVSDGVGSTVAQIVVNVGGAGGPGQAVSGSWIVGNPQLCVVGGNFLSLLPLDGITQFSWDIDPATVGAAFTADFSATVPAAVWGMSFYGADGSNLGFFQVGPGVPGSSASVTGTVPEGAVAASAAGCLIGLLSTIEYVAGGGGGGAASEPGTAPLFSFLD